MFIFRFTNNSSF